MAQDQNVEEVLLARNNETGQVGAVTGLNEDGTPKMADAKSAKLSDLVKFSKGQNPLEAFMSNFLRQCKNPSTFGFFKVPADRFESVGVAMADLAKAPEANAEMLKDFKVEITQQEQAKQATVEKKPADADTTKTPQSEHKYQAIDENKIDWPVLKEKWGIDRNELEKSGDLKEMLYNRKSRLVTITPTFAGEKYSMDARLAFKEDADGNIKVVPHFIRKQPDLSQEFNGVKFTDKDKTNLLQNGNLGRLADVVDKKTGEAVPSFISIDRMTNELVSVPAKQVFVRDTIGQTKLTMSEIGTLKTGKALPPKEILDKNGKKYTVVLQVNADRKGVEFVPQNGHKQEVKESNGEGQGQSSWLTKDGKIKPISKWAGVPMTEKQQADYVQGKTVVLSNMVDKEGKPCTVYLTFNQGKGRPTTSLKDPRQAQSVTPANESKTQMSVNNDGNTNEATKKVKEPLDKGQTAPKDEAQQRKSKGMKV